MSHFHSDASELCQAVLQVDGNAYIKRRNNLTLEMFGFGTAFTSSSLICAFGRNEKMVEFSAYQIPLLTTIEEPNYH